MDLEVDSFKILTERTLDRLDATDSPIPHTFLYLALRHPPHNQPWTGKFVLVCFSQLVLTCGCSLTSAEQQELARRMEKKQMKEFMGVNNTHSFPI